ncbi:hypothetical protein CV102_21095 [Natronococcus pandeyae]|uniref:Uncharacterized protein n=1 Tax=Natronococcus pandeyae TaxID=2055836 RepID=A0A8J8TNK7_9EURY|nr:hypothetical protein [Natronococcus pandeyae]TYL36771.1 hypothetical protein CV102_21095 [Natronococcus pandeyae]
MSDTTFAVHLVDGRVEVYETVTVLEDNDGDWIRCLRSEPSPREKLPETTKYYRCEDVARIERTDRNGSSQIVDRDQLEFKNALENVLSK